MAGADRMTIEEVVKKVLLDEHADVIREAVKAPRIARASAFQLRPLEASDPLPSCLRTAPTPSRRVALLVLVQLGSRG